MGRLGKGAVLVVLAVLAVAAVDELADRHQSRPARVPPGSTSEIVFEVDTNGYHQPLAVGAASLYAACIGTTTRRVVAEEGFQQVGPDRFRFVVAPALGDNNELKLRGCLEDFTVDRVLGDVVSITQHNR